MPPNSDLAQTVYLAQRATQNARRRWRMGLALLCVAAALLLSHLLSGSMRNDGVLTPRECFALTFAYLGGVALLGLLAGPKPPARGAPWVRLLDDGWMAMLMPGAAALATLDAAKGDLTGYIMVCLPVAIFHSTDPRSAIALQLFAFACAVAGVLLYSEMDAGAGALFLSVVGACAGASGYIAVVLEEGRRNAFVTARELELRSAALAEANARLESNNRKLELRTAELARLNADLEESGAALARANARLEELAGTDPLTGAANRRQFLEAMAREFGRVRRYGDGLALALIDLDDFGPVNKRHGVIAGDEVLAEFAAALRAQTRAVDLVARYGGEEFVVLMPGCDAESAAQLMERVRERVAATPLGSRGITITFSAGVTALEPADDDPLDAVHRADTALRRAKAGGKNRVERS